jgi:hypothetical protein
MLERQPDEVRQLLLRTSLLDRVNGELADLLTGCAGSESEGGVMGMTQKPSRGPRLLSLPTKAFVFPI